MWLVRKGMEYLIINVPWVQSHIIACCTFSSWPSDFCICAYMHMFVPGWSIKQACMLVYRYNPSTRVSVLHGIWVHFLLHAKVCMRSESFKLLVGQSCAYKHPTMFVFVNLQEEVVRCLYHYYQRGVITSLPSVQQVSMTTDRLTLDKWSWLIDWLIVSCWFLLIVDCWYSCLERSGARLDFHASNVLHQVCMHSLLKWVKRNL